jgi:hypothetical protein
VPAHDGAGEEVRAGKAAIPFGVVEICKGAVCGNDVSQAKLCGLSSTAVMR